MISWRCGNALTLLATKISALPWRMKDFTLKESPPAMFKMLDVTGPGVGRTWNIFPFTDGGSPLSQPVLLRKSKQETMVFTIKLVGEKTWGETRLDDFSLHPLRFCMWLDEPTMELFTYRNHAAMSQIVRTPHFAIPILGWYSVLICFNNQHIPKKTCCLWTVWVYAGVWGNLNGFDPGDITSGRLAGSPSTIPSRSTPKSGWASWREF